MTSEATFAPTARHDSSLICARFDRDGTRLIAGLGNEARVWEVPSGRQIGKALRAKAFVF